MRQRTDPFRLLRAGIATAVIFALATGAHLAGGGMLPEPVLLFALAAFTLAAVSITAGRRFRPGSLFLVLGAAQLGLHEAFGTLTSGVQCLPGTSPHHGVAVVCPEAVPPPGAGGGTALAGLHTLQHDAGPALFLAHLAAVMLSTLALARGEEALHATAAWLRPLFAPPAPVTLRPVTRLQSPLPPPAPRAPGSAPHARCAGRRRAPWPNPFSLPYRLQRGSLAMRHRKAFPCVPPPLSSLPPAAPPP